MPLQKNLNKLLAANDIPDYNGQSAFIARVFIGNSLREDRELGWITTELVKSGNLSLMGTAMAGNLVVANIGGLACCYYANGFLAQLEGEVYIASIPAMSVLELIHATEMGLHSSEHINAVYTKVVHGEDQGQGVGCTIYMGPSIRNGIDTTWPVYLRPPTADGMQTSTCPVLLEGTRATREEHVIVKRATKHGADMDGIIRRMREREGRDEWIEPEDPDEELEILEDDEEEWDDEV